MRVLSGKAFQRTLNSRKISLFLFLCSLEHISKRFHYFRSNRAVAPSLLQMVCAILNQIGIATNHKEYDAKALLKMVLNIPT